MNRDHFLNENPEGRVSALPSGSRAGTIEEVSPRLTGIPELVLIPAPVTTTTFRAFPRALATSWRRSGVTGVT